MGQQSVVPAVEAGYAFGISKEIALGLTGTYDLTNTKGGSSGTANLDGKKHYSITALTLSLAMYSVRARCYTP